MSYTSSSLTRQWYPPLETASQVSGKAILLLAGVHGDIEALRAILKHVPESSYESLVTLGNSCFGQNNTALDTWLLLQEHEALLLRGDKDSLLGTPKLPQEIKNSAVFKSTQKQLGHLICRRLYQRPYLQVLSFGRRSGVLLRSQWQEHNSTRFTKQLTTEQSQHLLEQLEEQILVIEKNKGFELYQKDDKIIIQLGALRQKREGKKDLAQAALLQEFKNGTVRVALIQVPL